MVKVFFIAREGEIKMVYVWLVMGFVLLVKGADWFVSGASGIAKRLRIPAVVIGLTVVAFGTSAPEMAVSISAAIQGKNEIALGNVVGSNIFNLLMVLGISGIIFPLTVDKSVLRRDFPLSIFAAALMGGLALSGYNKNNLGHIDGIIMALIFTLYMVFLVRHALKDRKDKEPSEIVPSALPQKSMTINILASAVGLVCVVLGGNLVVESASSIARSFGVSENLIALTIVAIGTSLPELVTSIVAAVKKENDIAVGNVIGSNLFNILCILGISAAINPINVAAESYWDILICLVISAAYYLYALKKKSIGRGAGISMVVLYMGYTAYLLVR